MTLKTTAGLIEVYSSGPVPLQMRARIAANFLKRCPIEIDVLYSRKEIYAMLKESGINEKFQQVGFGNLHPLREGITTSLTKLLKNLHANNMVRKYAKGIASSGRPFGVMWMLK